MCKVSYARVKSFLKIRPTHPTPKPHAPRTGTTGREKTMPAIYPRSMINKMADGEAVPLENDFHVSNDINLDIEGDIRVQGISSDDEDETTLDEPISATLVCIIYHTTAILF